MRVVVVYKQESDHGRAVSDYLRDFERVTGRQLETMDPEQRGSAGFCETYDIVEYPTVVALDNSGQLQNMWRGLPLPTINEVEYYA